MFQLTSVGHCMHFNLLQAIIHDPCNLELLEFLLWYILLVWYPNLGTKSETILFNESSESDHRDLANGPDWSSNSWKTALLEKYSDTQRKQGFPSSSFKPLCRLCMPCRKTSVAKNLGQRNGSEWVTQESKNEDERRGSNLLAWSRRRKVSQCLMENRNLKTEFLTWSVRPERLSMAYFMTAILRLHSTANADLEFRLTGHLKASILYVYSGFEKRVNHLNFGFSKRDTNRRIFKVP